jgi:peroxiredoxin (alkyl hydroperoxide reductase subunit C)
MKKVLILIVFFVSCLFPLKSQQRFNSNIPKTGNGAPEYLAKTTQGRLDFPDHYGNYWEVLFSHPRDFSPVCSSELLQLAKIQNEFTMFGTNLVVTSADYLQTHYQGIKDLESINKENFEPVKINLPLVADDHFVLSKKYGMMHKSISTTQTVRCVSFLNPDNKFVAVVFYQMNVSRSLDDMKSTLFALQSAC